MFENASESFLAANPCVAAGKRGAARYRAESLRRRGNMNATESDFAMALEAQKRAGEILRYEFEGLTLRWADMRYTPDFVVFPCGGLVLQQLEPAPIKLIEVKGGHIWSRDIVRFKGARAYWPEFAFEMWQKTKQGWKRLH